MTANIKRHNLGRRVAHAHNRGIAKMQAQEVVFQLL